MTGIDPKNGIVKYETGWTSGVMGVYISIIHICIVFFFVFLLVRYAKKKKTPRVILPPAPRSIPVQTQRPLSRQEKIEEAKVRKAEADAHKAETSANLAWLKLEDKLKGNQPDEATEKLKTYLIIGNSEQEIDDLSAAEERELVKQGYRIERR
jgi:hypothetical protein